jgi:hypothetical protein
MKQRKYSKYKSLFEIKFNLIIIILLFSLFISILIAYLTKDTDNFISSLFLNISAGFITGLIILIVTNLKNIEKSENESYISALDEIIELCFNFEEIYYEVNKKENDVIDFELGKKSWHISKEIYYRIFINKDLLSRKIVNKMKQKRNLDIDKMREEQYEWYNKIYDHMNEKYNDIVKNFINKEYMSIYKIKMAFHEEKNLVKLKNKSINKSIF